MFKRKTVFIIGLASFISIILSILILLEVFGPLTNTLLKLILCALQVINCICILMLLHENTSNTTETNSDESHHNSIMRFKQKS